MTRVHGGWRSGARGPKALLARLRMDERARLVQSLRQARTRAVCSMCGGEILGLGLRAALELCAGCRADRETRRS